MRWKIKSVNTTENSTTGIKTTTKTKQLVVTVGEAIGVGKTAVGAVQAAVKSLKTLNKANPKAGLAPLAATADVLLTLVKGLEVYGQVMSVIEKVTPVVQLVARGSGLWASPGNVGDIAQIILGQAQKILVAIIVASINSLKDYVWNYEFVLKEIDESFEESINKNIEDLNKKLNGETLSGILDNLVGESESDNANSFLSDMSSGSIALGDIFSLDDPNRKWFSEAYKTEYIIPNQNYVRMLRGSYKDYGIQYSDDNGETWQQTHQEDGSWYHFAKIKATIEGQLKTIYVAGGRDYVKSLKDPASPPPPIATTNYYYNDNVNIQTMTKYQKENNIYPLKDKDEFVASKGIYYSIDEGLTWTAIQPFNIEVYNEQGQRYDTVTTSGGNINGFCEFEEKAGNIVASITAASDDFDGCFYTADGTTWTQTFKSEKWLNIEAYDDIMTRIPALGAVFITGVDVLGITRGQSFDGDITASFKTGVDNLQVAHNTSLKNYLARAKELLTSSSHPTTDEVKAQLGPIPEPSLD